MPPGKAQQPLGFIHRPVTLNSPRGGRGTGMVLDGSTIVLGRSTMVLGRGYHGIRKVYHGVRKVYHGVGLPWC